MNAANQYVVIGKLVFGVARIFASFNDTFVHVTDLRFVTQCDTLQSHNLGGILTKPVVAKPSAVSPVV